MAKNRTFSITSINKVLIDLKEEMSWSELAEKSNIDKSTLSAIRNGNRRFTNELAASIANGLGINLSDLYAQIAHTQIEEYKLATISKYVESVHIGKDFKSFVESYIENLSKGDLYINISLQPSVEFESTQSSFSKEVVEAAEKGIVFYYIFPSLSYTNLNKIDVQDNNLSGTSNLILVDLLDTVVRYNTWRNRLLKEKDSKNLVDNIKSISVDISEHWYLFTPFTRFILVVRNSKNEELDTKIESWIEVLQQDTNSNSYSKLNSNISNTLYQFFSDILNLSLNNK